jgi:NADPH-dependent ferric siderophore reductase
MSLVETAVRPAYRPYAAEVTRVDRLSPHFVRVTFTADDFAHFGTAGLDQRVKLILQARDGILEDSADEGDWYGRWRALPLSERGVMRTYTVRRVDPAAAEVDVDFVLHGATGPAGAWAESVTPGERLILVGPDERSPYSRTGLDWRPGAARRLLIVGDETAVPAVSGILTSLDDSYEVDVFLEIPSPGDELHLSRPPGARVHWIPRDDAAHGERLIAAVTEWTTASGDLLAAAAAPVPQSLEDIDVDVDLLWDSPAADDRGGFYAWIAGEAGAVKTLRRLLVSTRGVDRRRVAFMGYWRLGQAERSE